MIVCQGGQDSGFLIVLACCGHQVLAGEKTIALRALVDRSIAEFSLANRRSMFTARYYPTAAQTEAQVKAADMVVVSTAALASSDSVLLHPPPSLHSKRFNPLFQLERGCQQNNSIRFGCEGGRGRGGRAEGRVRVRNGLRMGMMTRSGELHNYLCDTLWVANTSPKRAPQNSI